MEWRAAAFSRYNSGMRRFLWLAVGLFVVMGLVGGYYYLHRFDLPGARSSRVIEWIVNPQAHPDWALTGGTRCEGAPFLIPSSGYMGYLWGDSFKIGHQHQGFDLFGGTQPGETPVVAAYSGYLTREDGWKSSLIIRIPQDPLEPRRQIWTYYTHMADAQGHSLIDAAFPPGSREVYVEAGTLLGLQGNYSGDPANPVGVHLHFSIVLDDGQGKYRNELEKANTLDPSPYFGLPLNADTTEEKVIPLCP